MVPDTSIDSLSLVNKKDAGTANSKINSGVVINWTVTAGSAKINWDPICFWSKRKPQGFYKVLIPSLVTSTDYFNPWHYLQGTEGHLKVKQGTLHYLGT